MQNTMVVGVCGVGDCWEKKEAEGAQGEQIRRG